MLSVFEFHGMPLVNMFCAVICGSLLGRELFQSVCKHAVLYLSVIAQRLTSIAAKVDRLTRKRCSSNWSQNRLSLFLQNDFFPPPLFLRWLRIQASVVCAMCAVPVSMGRTEGLSLPLGLSKVAPWAQALTCRSRRKARALITCELRAGLVAGFPFFLLRF